MRGLKRISCLHVCYLPSDVVGRSTVGGTRDGEGRRGTANRQMNRCRYCKQKKECPREFEIPRDPCCCSRRKGCFCMCMRSVMIDASKPRARRSKPSPERRKKVFSHCHCTGDILPMQVCCEEGVIICCGSSETWSILCELLKFEEGNDALDFNTQYNFE